MAAGGPTLPPIPEPPDLAVLAFRFRACDMDCLMPGTIVLADGRVLRTTESGMTVRRLTPSGLQRIRDTVEATGLFDAPAMYDPVRIPGRESGGFGPMMLMFDVGAGAEQIRVTAADPAPFVADNESGAPTWIIPPESLVLGELWSKVGDLDAWLTADAWQGPAQPFVADDYLLLVARQGGLDPLPPFNEIDDIDWPFPTTIDAMGHVLPPSMSGSDMTVRCLAIDRPTAEAMSAAEAAAQAEGWTRGLEYPVASVPYVSRRIHGQVEVTTQMILPYQPPTCEGARQY